ncbi:HET-domain-containing protein [Curvularia clavata]|uniref:HET-domain-containing protein n=1 Tax=Curvularia clavata TaxID=95742 RepID=A0A9Q8ZFA5_CURCL|nr:HET-domain-containing protein [Curvularia clavata]
MALAMFPSLFKKDFGALYEDPQSRLLWIKSKTMLFYSIIDELQVSSAIAKINIAVVDIFTDVLRDPSLTTTYLVIDALDKCVTDLQQRRYLKDSMGSTAISNSKLVLIARLVLNLEVPGAVKAWQMHALFYSTHSNDAISAGLSRYHQPNLRAWRSSRPSILEIGEDDGIAPRTAVADCDLDILGGGDVVRDADMDVNEVAGMPSCYFPVVDGTLK